MRSQLASIVNSRDNTEQLNQKLTEERRFLDKELINLRAQLALSHQPHLLQAQEPLYLTSLPPSFGGTTRFQNKADISDFQLSKKKSLIQKCHHLIMTHRTVKHRRFLCPGLPDLTMYLFMSHQRLPCLISVREQTYLSAIVGRGQPKQNEPSCSNATDLQISGELLDL